MARRRPVRDFGHALADGRAAANSPTDDRAREVDRRRCQAWAGCFTWDRSAELLAGVAHSAADGATALRSARSDMGVIVEFVPPADWSGMDALRPTDQADVRDGRVRLLLTGCDEIDAATTLQRLGIDHADVRLADRYDLLVGPARLPEALTRPVSGMS